MRLDDVRRMAMALLGTTGSLHHQYIHLGDRMVRLQPKVYERSGWGRKVVGLRVDLGRARPDDVRGLLRTAWQRKLGKR